MRLTQSLHQALQQDPGRVLTVFGDRSRTVSECVDRVARLAGAMKSLGVAPGDRVGIMALNSDRYHEFLLAVPWAGGVVNPVNIRWSPGEVAYSLVDCRTDVLFVDDVFAHRLSAIREQATNLRVVIHCGEDETPDGALGYEQLVSANAPVADAGRGGDDLYGVFYTGGTTGHPKGVMLSHNAMLISAMGGLVAADLLTRGGRILHAAPLFHLADLWTWNMGMLTGSTHVIVPTFTPAGVAAAVAKHRVTDALLVPTMIQLLVDSPEVADADLATVRRVIYGASPIAEALLNRARAKLAKAEFIQAYGMTELAPLATLLTSADHSDPTLARACGRAAGAAEIRIVDPDDNEVALGTVGEIVVRGDQVMQGYWNRPDETAEALRGGWMHTGDGGYMDERGYVFIVDRLKDIIITGGENVYSAEVENALAKHGAVAQAAVIGIPDERWGERVHAVIVLAPGATVTADQLREFCRGHVANYKLPRSMAFVDALPISAAGKVLKRELRAMRWASGTDESAGGSDSPIRKDAALLTVADGSGASS